MAKTVLQRDTEADPQQTFVPVAAVSDVKVVTRTLTNLEILDLASGNVNVIEGIVDRAIWAISACVVTHPVDGGWDSVPQALLLTVGPAPYLTIADADTVVFNDSPVFVAFAVPAEPIVGSFGQLEALPLYVYTDVENPTSNGGGSGTMDITVLYREVDVS